MYIVIIVVLLTTVVYQGFKIKKLKSENKKLKREMSETARMIARDTEIAEERLSRIREELKLGRE